jgi:GNAT superfamily N-acetyltransferase
LHLTTAKLAYAMVNLSLSYFETKKGMFAVGYQVRRLFIDHLVVPEASRGEGLDTRLVHLAEREAKGRNCINVWLKTFEFKARGFYEKLGYACFGQLTGYPSGFSRFFMQKPLGLGAT